MSEETPPNANSAAQSPQGPEFVIQKIYIKDLSFESPGVPGVFLKEWQGETNLQLNNKVQVLNEQEGVYEVELAVTVTTKSQGETAYLVEVKQAGVFLLRQFADEQRGHLLGAYCPNILFPFAREVVADMVLRGGFPQLLLQPINFDAFYLQRRQEQGAAGVPQPASGSA